MPMTKAQHEALENGGLSQYCYDNHDDMVCPHCGCCRRCMSGCQCDQELADCDCGGCDEYTAPELADAGGWRCS
jgi:hypothetical protein